MQSSALRQDCSRKRRSANNRILELAVRGKLFQHNLNDEPASKLIQRIQVERSRLVKEGKPELPLLEAKEILFELPERWEWLRPGNVGFTQTGTMPSSNHPEYFGDYIPFVKPADLTGNSINYTGDGISEEGITNIPALFPSIQC